MESASESTTPKVNKGGFGLHRNTFCYVRLEWEDDDKLEEKFNFKSVFNETDPELSEYTKLRWFGYHKASKSYVAYRELSNGRHMHVMFSLAPLKEISSPFVCMNMVEPNDKLQEMQIFRNVCSYFGYESNKITFLTTLIYPGLDKLEFELEAGVKALNMIEYGSTSTEYIMESVFRCLNANVVEDELEVRKITEILMFISRFDLGHYDAGDKYYPRTLCFGDMNFIINRAGLNHLYDVDELAKAFKTYCTEDDVTVRRKVSEYVLYVPEPIFLCAFLATRVRWV